MNVSEFRIRSFSLVKILVNRFIEIIFSPTFPYPSSLKLNTEKFFPQVPRLMGRRLLLINFLTNHCKLWLNLVFGSVNLILIYCLWNTQIIFTIFTTILWKSQNNYFFIQQKSRFFKGERFREGVYNFKGMHEISAVFFSIV